jgi:hypothetical protein
VFRKEPRGRRGVVSSSLLAAGCGCCYAKRGCRCARQRRRCGG